MNVGLLFYVAIGGFLRFKRFWPARGGELRKVFKRKGLSPTCGNHCAGSFPQFLTTSEGPDGKSRHLTQKSTYRCECFHSGVFFLFRNIPPPRCGFPRMQIYLIRNWIRHLSQKNVFLGQALGVNLPLPKYSPPPKYPIFWDYGGFRKYSGRAGNSPHSKGRGKEKYDHIQGFL